jgi:DNA-binding response OmpR family regulator
MHKILVIGANELTIDILDRASRDLESEFAFVQPNEIEIVRRVRERLDFVIIDSTEMELDAVQINDWLRKERDDLLIMLLSPEGTSLMQGPHINIHLVQPFTARKLGNRIRKLLSIRRTQPLVVGKFTLDPEKRRLSHFSTIVRLTPKEYRLLDLFLRHAGTVLSRKQIMKEVWETDYLGDTRTLDVHIRWLREKIEANPKTPVYLRTVRRVGYILDPTEPDQAEDETQA